MQYSPRKWFCLLKKTPENEILISRSVEISIDSPSDAHWCLGRRGGGIFSLEESSLVSCFTCLHCSRWSSVLQELRTRFSRKQLPRLCHRSVLWRDYLVGGKDYVLEDAIPERLRAWLAAQRALCVIWMHRICWLLLMRELRNMRSVLSLLWE